METRDNNEHLAEHVVWVDVAKFMAIFAVLIDHSHKTLYESHYIQYFSFYSVSLFILVLGITTMWSFRRKGHVLDQVKTKCLKIIRPYIVASVIYAICIYQFFDFGVILEGIIRFNISGPFYYVLLYIQLILISPVIYAVFNRSDDYKRTALIEIAGLVIILVVSCFTTNRSDILEVYGGGGRLLGGTYLILFYVGMWFGKYYDRIHINRIPAIISAITLCACTIVWWRIISDHTAEINSVVPYGLGLNPPSISFGLYAILVALTLFFIEKLLLFYPSGFPMKVMKWIAFIGNHTLYIFLYHMLFLSIIYPKFSQLTGLVIYNIWIKRVVFLCGMIFGPMIIEFALEKIHRLVIASYYTD